MKSPESHEWAADLGLVEIGLDAIEELEILLDFVAAVHEFEHAVAAGLSGDVEIAADARVIADDFKHVVAEVARIAGDEAEAQDGRHFIVDAAQEIGEGGDIRASERIACGGHRCKLRPFCGWTMPLTVTAAPCSKR
jgi:hypothetical protein